MKTGKFGFTAEGAEGAEEELMESRPSWNMVAGVP